MKAYDGAQKKDIFQSLRKRICKVRDWGYELSSQVFFNLNCSFIDKEKFNL